MKLKISTKQRDKMWWLLISVDYDYSRIAIADHEINGEALTLWLEDKHDFKNSLEECLQLTFSLKDFRKVIVAENLNSYEGTKNHPKHNFIMKCRVEINEPIKWYLEDASMVEQQWAREAMVKTIITQLVENEVDENIF